jgi:hypothetical protein
MWEKITRSSFTAAVGRDALRPKPLQGPCFGDIRKFIIFAMGFQGGSTLGILLQSHDMPSIIFVLLRLKLAAGGFRLLEVSSTR